MSNGAQVGVGPKGEMAALGRQGVNNKVSLCCDGVESAWVRGVRGPAFSSLTKKARGKG